MSSETSGDGAAPSHVKYLSPTSGTGSDGSVEFVLSPEPAIDASQVQVQLPKDQKEGATLTTEPKVTKKSDTTATASSASTAPAAGANTITAANAKLAAVRAQVTDACHITQPENGGDGNVFVHVIDGTGQFSCSPADLTYLVLHSATRPSASDYSVVGIMGCQSTGKSTLLNLLFGTKFQEMDSSRGRSQTTKGVWMDSGAKKRDLVIMDLEGTDSGERGEDRTTFERQTSLYALAVAEVLLINMWEHDIGRYTASNYGILKTVFEVNLQLFDTQNKTILMFVIRDHIEEDTPLAQLVTKLQKEVEKIWGEIRKPDKFAATPVEDLFELRFFALPHMKLQKQLFHERVDALRAQFTNPSDAEYLFPSSSTFHGKKAVPADGFGVYMQQCWAAIQTNKELNLPTQKEMLATFRCDEIIAQLYKDRFVDGIAELKAQASERLIANEFAASVNPLLRSILSEYTDATQHYHRDIVATKKVEFLRKMLRELEELYLTQARKFVAQRMIDVLKRELKMQLGAAAAGSPAAKPKNTSASSKSASHAVSSDAPHPDFLQAVSSARSAAHEFAGPELAKFQLDLLTEGDAGESIGVGPEEHKALVGAWSSLTHKIEEELATLVSQEVALARTGQLKKLTFHLDKLFKSAISQPLSGLLKKGNPETMWRDIGALWRQVYNNVIQKYVRAQLLPNYEASGEEAAQIEAQSSEQLHQLFRSIVDQHASMIQVYMRSRFDKLFRSDPKTGRVRTWTNGENIRALFKHARDEALKQLDLFAVFRLDEYKDEDSEANVAAREAEEAATAALNRRPSLSRKSSMRNTTAPTESKDEAEASSLPPEEQDAEEEDKIGHTTIDYSQVDAVNIILDPTQRLEKESTFRFEIESALREAEIAQAQNASNTKVPLWMIGLVCFLGMDEILAVLRNPLLLFFLVVVGGGAYMAHTVGALMPMITVAKTTVQSLLAQAQSNFAPVVPPVPAASSSGARRTSLTNSRRAAHSRNPSLAFMAEAVDTPRNQSRTSSLTSSDMLPKNLAVKSQVEMKDMSPSPSPRSGTSDDNDDNGGGEIEMEPTSTSGLSKRTGRAE